ncbi:hypothetical protein JST99_04455 [Candidatus Dependentiae bacterium]|nr:hypothetical protein [Candidatus Dependentiae bacterium]
MKGFKLLSVLLLFLCANQSHGQASPLLKQSWSAATIATLHKLTFEVFRKDPALPPEVFATLTEHSDELKAFSDECGGYPLCGGRGVRQFNWLPGWYIKHGIERFENTKKLNRFIEEHNLDLISPQTKYLLHVPGKPFKYSNKNYLVISKEVPRWRPALTLGDVAQEMALNRQLNKVESELPHWDLQPRNIEDTPNGTVTIIDTDRYAMGKNKPKNKWLGCPSWWHHDIICAI